MSDIVKNVAETLDVEGWPNKYPLHPEEFWRFAQATRARVVAGDGDDNRTDGARVPFASESIRVTHATDDQKVTVLVSDPWCPRRWPEH